MSFHHRSTAVGLQHKDVNNRYPTVVLNWEQPHPDYKHYQNHPCFLVRGCLDISPSRSRRGLCILASSKVAVFAVCGEFCCCCFHMPHISPHLKRIGYRFHLVPHRFRLSPVITQQEHAQFLFFFFLLQYYLTQLTLLITALKYSVYTI